MQKTKLADLPSYLHQVWLADTQQGCCVMKQLNPQFVATIQQRAAYNLKEKIAKQWAQAGLPIIAAEEIQGEALQTNGEDYLLTYPFVKGEHITGTSITASHAKQIGQLLANIHLQPNYINHEQENLLEPPLRLTLDNTYWQDLLAQAASLLPELKPLINDSEAYLLQAIKDLPAAKAKLIKQVISHRDLTPRNVLWQGEDNFYVIDNEWLGLIHPEVDVMITALDWSLSSVGWNKELFSAVKQGYQQSAKVGLHSEMEMVWLLVLEHWCSWLEFNLQRRLDVGVANQFKERSEQEIKYTLVAIKIMREQFEILRKNWASP